MYGEKILMAQQEYLAAVNSYLMDRYFIGLSDTGYSDEEWLFRFGDLDVEEAVEVYAEKYELFSKNDWFY